MSASPRIVVTGFEPFEHGSENPTLAVLDQLGNSNDIDGHLTTIPLPVDSDALTDIVSDKLEALRPDLWISLGLAPGLSVIAVERVAANVRDFMIADNVGKKYGGEPVFETAPAAYFATIPVKTIATKLRESGIPSKVSNSPSTYLCNQMMYTILHLISVKGMDTKAGFIHVPAHPGLVAQQEYPFVEMPSMSIDLMTAAVKTAIRTALTTEADSRDPCFNF